VPQGAQGDLAGAKARAATSFFHDHIENQRDYMSFMATSPHSEEEVLAAIAALTPATVTAALEAMRCTAPGLFATGDIEHVPSVRQLGFKHTA